MCAFACRRRQGLAQQADQAPLVLGAGEHVLVDEALARQGAGERQRGLLLGLVYVRQRPPRRGQQALQRDVVVLHRLEQRAQQAVLGHRREVGGAEQRVGGRQCRPRGFDPRDAFADGGVLLDQAGGDDRERARIAPRLVDRADQVFAIVRRMRGRTRIAQAEEEQRAGFRRLVPLMRIARDAQRALEIAEPDERLGEIDRGLRQIRFQREPALEAGGRLGQFAARHQRATEIVVRLGIAGVARERLPVPADRLVALALGAQRVAEVEVGRSQARLERERALMPLRGLRRVALRHQHGAEIVVRLGIVGPQRERLMVARGRIGRAAERGQRIGEVVVSLRQARPQREHALIGPDRLRMLALAGQRIAEVHVRLGVVRLERDRLAVMRGGFVEPAERPVGEADIVVEVRHPLVQRQRLADQLDRGVAAADLVGEHAEQVQRVDMLGVGRQHLAVMLLGLLHPPGLMRAQRGRKLGRGLRGAEAVPLLRLFGHHGPSPSRRVSG